MNILMAVDSAYVKHAKVTIFSVAYHNPEHLCLYLLHSGLKQGELQSLGNFVRRRCHGELIPVFLDREQFKKLPIRGHFSRETYYRIYAPYLLPAAVERILWLDADLVVKKSLKSLYEKDFDGKCLIACENAKDSVEESVRRLGLKRAKYFNAGVLLMNLKAMREYADKERLEAFVYDNLSLFLWQDQDILNLFFEDSCLFADSRYNCQVPAGESFEEKAVQEAAVLHYVGGLKPWSHAYIWKIREYYGFYLKKVSLPRYIALQTVFGLYRLWKKRQKI